MSYPYDELEWLLQIKTKPISYHEAFKRRIDVTHIKRNEFNDIYDSMLPIYKFAECPMSGIECYQPVDTYDLGGASVQNELNGFRVSSGTSGQSSITIPPRNTFDR